ncbi:molybdate ABC transporter substrate-binding protein [Aeromicrobium fastidiosum]|uniref:molybdate ABC transporter substrate-binding protein n=1 Tax=Aeromicrobium fastidiosum TaxID=52699 RepID=UPI002023270E|nr:molybdate ABC transporter substrate-binding protein [Aeromicrobium fastidiosum]MCL8251410.1 molybdate ABC transporter substrate-binding protein [Aeromicrobium fastidiosum]
MKRLIGTAAAALLLTSVAACGSSDDAAAGSSSDAPRETTLTVYAAASLKSSFTEIGAAFEKANPGVSVTFSFAGSADLVAQIQQGAPADVFASADTANMDKATADDLVEGTPADFATNTLEIATPPDNPADVDSLDDLADPDVTVVVCAAEVPCGAAAAGVEKAAGLDIRPVSEEQSVTDVLGKVISGEADAGLVYVTDVRGAGDKVAGVPIPESADVVNTYPIAALAGSRNPDVAKAFTAYVTGPEGRSILTAAGFGAP